MDLPRNLFKARLKAGTQQIGMWNMIGGNTVPEMLAGAGYDWVLVDCEHAPVDTLDVLPALQAIGQYPDVSAVVRPAANDPVLFKRLLDIGAQTLLVPYVQSAEEARAAVSAMRYGPRGIRGMAGAMRATRYGRVTDYFTRAEEEAVPDPAGGNSGGRRRAGRDRRGGRRGRHLHRACRSERQHGLSGPVGTPRGARDHRRCDPAAPGAGNAVGHPVSRSRRGRAIHGAGHAVHCRGHRSHTSDAGCGAVATAVLSRKAAIRRKARISRGIKNE